MTPYEMEEQLRNLDERTSALEQILPLVATKEDLKAFATKDDLDLTTKALQHEIEAGFQEAKNHADRLNDITREQILLLRGEMTAMKDDLRGEMTAMKDDLRGEMMGIKDDLRAEMTALRRDLQGEMIALNGVVRADIRALAEQITARRTRRSNK